MKKIENKFMLFTTLWWCGLGFMAMILGPMPERVFQATTLFGISVVISHLATRKK